MSKLNTRDGLHRVIRKMSERIYALEADNARQRALIEELKSQVAAASETCPGCQMEPNQTDLELDAAWEANLEFYSRGDM